MAACVVCGCEVRETGKRGRPAHVCSPLCGERRDRERDRRYNRHYYATVTKPARSRERDARREREGSV